MEHPDDFWVIKKNPTKSTKNSYDWVQLTKRILNIWILSWKHMRDIFIKCGSKIDSQGTSHYFENSGDVK